MRRLKYRQAESTWSWMNRGRILTIDIVSDAKAFQSCTIVYCNARGALLTGHAGHSHLPHYCLLPFYVLVRVGRQIRRCEGLQRHPIAISKIAVERCRARLLNQRYGVAFCIPVGSMDGYVWVPSLKTSFVCYGSHHFRAYVPSCIASLGAGPPVRIAF